MTIEQLTSERRRNRLLRLVDWRFLLSDPSPRTTGCFGDAELEEALSLVLPRVVSKRMAGLDLAVVVDPDAAALRDAHRFLRPGGSLVVEWREGRFGISPSRREDLLRRAGFTGMRHYTAHPRASKASPERWTPLEGQGAIHFSLRTRPAARTPLRQLARGLQRLLWVSSRRSRRPATLCSLAIRPPRRAAPSQLRSATSAPWEEMVRSGWSGWGMGEPPARLSSLLLTGGVRSVNKVVALVFADDERNPRVAVKMPRVPESVAALEREGETLTMLQQRAPELRGVPRVLFREGSGERLLLGETVVPGRRFTDLLTPSTFTELADGATAWQQRLRGEGRRPAGASRSAHVRRVVADFEASYGAVADPSMLAEAVDQLGALASLPAVCEQRDFAPWNILRTEDGALGVLDWESSEPEGFPALDLIYLLTYLSIYHEGANRSGRYEAAYESMLDPSTPVGIVAERCLGEYLDPVGIGRELLRPLRLFGWMLHARSAHQRLTADACAPPPAEQLRQSLFLRLWETEMRQGAAA